MPARDDLNNMASKNYRMKQKERKPFSRFLKKGEIETLDIVRVHDMEGGWECQALLNKS